MGSRPVRVGSNLNGDVATRLVDIVRVLVDDTAGQLLIVDKGGLGIVATHSKEGLAELAYNPAGIACHCLRRVALEGPLTRRGTVGIFQGERNNSLPSKRKYMSAWKGVAQGLQLSPHCLLANLDELVRLGDVTRLYRHAHL